MSKMLESVRRAFAFSRMTGNTDCAVDACRIHTEAYLVVVNHEHAKRIVQEYPELRDRIIPLGNFERLYGLHAPLVWDSSAVEYVIEQIHADLKRQVVEITGFHAV
jgi:hypothetical protein